MLQTEHDLRERLALQLHDGPLQSLISARQDLVELRERSPGGLPEEASDALESLEESVRSLRSLAVDTYPEDAREPLDDALRSLAVRLTARSGVPIAVETDGIDELRSGIMVGAAAELVGNALKHGDPHRIVVRAVAIGRSVRLTVADDGRGMPPDAAAAAAVDGHLGLRALDRRIRASGGRWRVRSAPGEGTAVEIDLPR